MQNFLNRNKVIFHQNKINELGPRFTGSEAHKKLIKYFEEELIKLDFQVLKDEHSFEKWEAKRWGLSIKNNSGQFEEVEVASYYPYSGETKGEAIGQLVYVKNSKDFKKAKGKIALVEVAVPKLPARLFFKKRCCYPEGKAKLPKKIVNSVIGSVLKGPNLKKAAEEGVLGVVCIWKNLSEESIGGQYLPFTTPYGQCPALWVNERIGEKLKSLAENGVEAKFLLEAQKEKAASETIYAVLKGKNERETIIVNTHTDGPNAVEENGGAALLMLAEYFSKIPVEYRNRTLVFVFVSGHFRIPEFGIKGQATTRWLENHKELWDGKKDNKKAVAGVTIEHLGCTGWTDVEGEFKKAEDLELELVYTGNKLMNKIYLNSLSGRSKVRSITLKPKANIYFGEGQPLYNAKIPTISLVPAPEYLCSVKESGHIEKLDIDFMLEQIESFVKVIEEIDKTKEIGEVEEQSFGILQLIIKE
ncbi:hypothetical protein [Clostridium felsineum]|uniref:hypothetical protein n=1 Tax=Clostridium felsineum TaxID=36839 RepID=UPI00098BECE8|nr:hypothetical protein [Clostridium felsineum]URZ15099.1 hypothetical protein CLFE_011160 [Clostridium felsineum DSM 794]